MCSATVKIFGVENQKAFYNDEFICKANNFFNKFSEVFGLEDEVSLERVDDCKIQKRISFDMNNNNCAVLDFYYASNLNTLKVISTGNNNWGNNLLMLEDLVISSSPIDERNFILGKENFKVLYSYTNPIQSFNDLNKVSHYDNDYRVVIDKEKVDLHHVNSIVKTENGMKIYFDDIGAPSEIIGNNFVVKMANNRDFIVYDVKINEYNEDLRTMKLDFLNLDTYHSIFAHTGDENSFSVEWYF